MKKSVVFLFVLSVFIVSVRGQDERDDERILAVQVNQAAGEDYMAVFDLGCDIGMETVVLSQDWTDIEVTPEHYESEIPAIINIFYPMFDMPVDLMIRPVHTNTMHLPDDLAGRSFSDPEVISRFNAMLDWVMVQMPDVTLNSLSIGSEIDGYLGTDAALWAEYTAFTIGVSEHIREHYPDVQIAFEMMIPGLLGDSAEYAQTLNQYADVIGASYYPLNADFSVQEPQVVHETFDALVEKYPDQPIYFYQIGYPSSEFLNSSEAIQAEFIREAFAAWDTHANNILMLDFTWITDQSEETVAGFEAYYGFSSLAFAEFLGTLGYRYHDGTPKQALNALREETAARGWRNVCG